MPYADIFAPVGVNADIHGRTITVQGQVEGNLFGGEQVILHPSCRVKGNITASGRLEILSTGRVWGDIMVSSLLIDEGGVLRGQSLMGSNDERFLIEGPRAPKIEIIEPDGQEGPEQEHKGRRKGQKNKTQESEGGEQGKGEKE